MSIKLYLHIDLMLKNIYTVIVICSIYFLDVVCIILFSHCGDRIFYALKGNLLIICSKKIKKGEKKR